MHIIIMIYQQNCTSLHHGAYTASIYSIHQELKSSVCISFAVNVSFAQSEYEIEESSESVLIEVLARGNLSESNFNIPVAVTGGTATGMYVRCLFITSYTSNYSTLYRITMHAW